jgi:hypothetical protein
MTTTGSRYVLRKEIDERGKILWRATIDGQEVVETSEPLASRGRKFNAWVQKIAPESQM